MTVLLSTDITAELLRPSLNPVVESRVAERPAAELHFSAAGEVELRYGVAILPTGRRRDALALAIEATLREDFEDLMAAFDSDAAREYAEIAATGHTAGRAVASADCQIAASACSHGMTEATRNVRDFEGIDVEVVNPWASA